MAHRLLLGEQLRSAPFWQPTNHLPQRREGKDCLPLVMYGPSDAAPNRLSNA